MSANRSTGSAAPSVQKIVLENSVAGWLRSGALRRRLTQQRPTRGSIEVYLRCPNLTVIGWYEEKVYPFSKCKSLLRVDLSGCPKLESIPTAAFAECRYLVEVVFGEHSNITKLGVAAFQRCSALKSITLPEKLTVISKATFNLCISLERIVCNEKLRTIGECAFQNCPKLEDFQLASSSISFDCTPTGGIESTPFGGCDRLIERAAATGFHSTGVSWQGFNLAQGVGPYLLDRAMANERKRHVLVANLRFHKTVNAHDGTEKEKVAAAKLMYANVRACSACGATPENILTCSGCSCTNFCNKQCQIDGWRKHNRTCKRLQGEFKRGKSRSDKILAAEFLYTVMIGGGVKGMLGEILSYV